MTDWSQKYDDGYDDVNYTSHQEESIPDKSAEGELDPMDVASPASAYFFLSDDAQDEIIGKKRKNMKCLECNYRFAGQINDSCPECFNLDTEETGDETDDGFCR